MPYKTRRYKKHKGGERPNNYILAENVSSELPVSYRVSNLKPKPLNARTIKKTIRTVSQPLRIQYNTVTMPEPQYATTSPHIPPVQLRSYSPQQNVIRVVNPTLPSPQKAIPQSAQQPSSVQPAQFVQPIAMKPLVQLAKPTLTRIRPTIQRSTGTRKLLRKRKN